MYRPTPPSTRDRVASGPLGRSPRRLEQPPGSAGTAFITDLRLSTSQRPKTCYSPDWISDLKSPGPYAESMIGTFGWPANLHPRRVKARPTKGTVPHSPRYLPPLTPTVLKKANETIHLASSYSRIYDQLHPRDAHTARLGSPRILTHDKRKALDHERDPGGGYSLPRRLQVFLK